MKITEMKGASLLPKKIIDDGNGIFTSASKSHNSAVTQLEQCSVEVDCEELENYLKNNKINHNKNSGKPNCKLIIAWDWEIAESLSKCKQNWLRLERK